jgi:arsenate reductase
MGCNVQCPFLPCTHREDWGLEDPSGKSDEAFLETIRLIEEKVRNLRHRMMNGMETADFPARRS